MGRQGAVDIVQSSFKLLPRHLRQFVPSLSVSSSKSLFDSTDTVLSEEEYDNDDDFGSIVVRPSFHMASSKQPTPLDVEEVSSEMGITLDGVTVVKAKLDTDREVISSKKRVSSDENFRKKKTKKKTKVKGGDEIDDIFS